MLDNIFILLEVIKEINENSSVFNRLGGTDGAPLFWKMDRSPNFIQEVWMEQVDLEHTNTCTG